MLTEHKQTPLQADLPGGHLPHPDPEGCAPGPLKRGRLHEKKAPRGTGLGWIGHGAGVLGMVLLKERVEQFHHVKRNDPNYDNRNHLEPADGVTKPKRIDRWNFLYYLQIITPSKRGFLYPECVTSLVSIFCTSNPDAHICPALLYHADFISDAVAYTFPLTVTVYLFPPIGYTVCSLTDAHPVIPRITGRVINSDIFSRFTL